MKPDTEWSRDGDWWRRVYRGLDLSVLESDDGIIAWQAWLDSETDWEPFFDGIAGNVDEAKRAAEKAAEEWTT